MILAFVYTEWQKGFTFACAVLLSLRVIGEMYRKTKEERSS